MLIHWELCQLLNSLACKCAASTFSRTSAQHLISFKPGASHFFSKRAAYKMTSESHLFTKTMQNISLFINILTILYMYHVNWCTLHNCNEPINTYNNTINYIHFLSWPEFTLMSCTKWNQPGMHSPGSSCWQQPHAHLQMMISHGETELGFNYLYLGKGWLT